MDHVPPAGTSAWQWRTGIVFLSHRRGTDGFALPVAMKFFSPERFHSQAAYEQAMARIGAVASR